MQEMNGQIALVTGAGRGIGSAIAKSLAKEGATVIVNYAGNAQAAQDTVDSILKDGGSAEKYQCDVSDFAAVEEMIKYIVQKYEKIDILVNNAGITKDGLLLRMSEQDFEQVLAVNLGGTFHCIRHAAKYMIKQRSGRIINLASVVGLTGNAGQANPVLSGLQNLQQKNWHPDRLQSTRLHRVILTQISQLCFLTV